MAVLTDIIGIVGSNVLNLLVYAVIVFVFIIGLIKCVFPVSRNRRILNNAIRSIRDSRANDTSWQEESFLGRGTLHSHWSEYLNNLFFADGVYHNASNVEDYINEETVIYDPGRGAFSDAVPGLLVSIGFLGTLIGLAQGLSGFSMDDSGAVMSSIVTLIPGMRYAFMTSIFGVIGSVSFTLITRAVQGSAMHTIRSFYSAMNRYAGVRSVDPMTQVAIYQQEQTAMIRQMAEDLSGRLSDNIAGAVAQAVEPLNQTMKNFVSVTTKDQMRFLDAVVNRFVDRMDDTMSGQMRRLSQTMTDTVDSMEAAYASLRSGIQDGSEMLDSVRGVTRIANDMVRDNAEYISVLREERRDTTDAIHHMDEIAVRQAELLKVLQSRQDDLSVRVSDMTDKLDRFTDALLRGSAENNAEMLRTAQSIREAGEALRSMHADALNSINKELRITLDAYQDYVNQFTKRVDYLASGISGSLEKLPDSVNEASDRFLDEIDRMSDALVRAEQEMTAATARIRESARR